MLDGQGKIWFQGKQAETCALAGEQPVTENGSVHGAADGLQPGAAPPTTSNADGSVHALPEGVLGLQSGLENLMPQPLQQSKAVSPAVIMLWAPTRADAYKIHNWI